jgi:poly-gamma-glutamate capsule biosynthesis protein CapA/YwtB (metallophosphatase superfamily)
MSKKTILKITIPLLFALALLLGFLQRGQIADFSFGSHTSTLRRQGTSSDSLEGYYQAGQQINQSANQQATATFLAGGDIMLSRNVAAEIKKAGNVNYPFRNMADVLKSTDFNFANLESPLSASAKSAIIGGHSLIFGAPWDNLKGLSSNNFKIVNLANNHTFDQGITGLNYTRSQLDTLNIQYEGTGENLGQAWQPAVVEAHGIKICFVGASFSSLNDGGKATNNYVARIEDITRLKTSVATAKSLCDFVVATMHAGTEYTRTPNQAQIAFAHTAIEDGADMVIGAHPHWVQTIEKYNGKYIFYSLGNFIFDQEWSQDTKEGLALKIQISKAKTQNTLTPRAATLDDLQGPRQPAILDSIQLIPIILENYSTPRPATAEETTKILNKIGQTETILKP